MIFATRGVGEHNPGILFGYHAFTRTYRLSVSTTNQNWELRLPENPLGWVHVGITWSKQWGLRFYPNGVLAAKATNPASIPYTFYDKYTKFWIGRESSSPRLLRGSHLQIADLRIWESIIPEQRMKEVHSNAGKLQSVKVPITFFLFSHLNLNIFQGKSAKEIVIFTKRNFL